MIEAFKGYRFFNTEVVSKYEFEGPEFRFEKICMNSPIVPISVGEEENLKVILSSLEDMQILDQDE